MHESQEWKDALETNGWTDAFMTGEEFEDLPDQRERAGPGVLSGLGLA
jgi:putative tricarboxylic transport membrane protein